MGRKGNGRYQTSPEEARYGARYGITASEGRRRCGGVTQRCGTSIARGHVPCAARDIRTCVGGAVLSSRDDAWQAKRLGDQAEQGRLEW